MDFTKMVFGGALIGTLVSCWQSVKAIAWKCANLFVKRISFGDDLAGHLTAYLINNYKYSKLYDRNFDLWHYYLKSQSRYGWVIGEKFSGSTMVFYNAKVPFLFTRKSSHSNIPDGKTTTSMPESKGGSIYYIRGTLDIDKILVSAANYHNYINKSKEKHSNRFVCQTFPKNNFRSNDNFVWESSDCKPISHATADIGFENARNSIDNLIFPEEVQKNIQLAEFWYSNKYWYNQKNIPWKTGWLLHGPGGTGKTSAARAIAEYLDIPLFVFRLGLLSSQEFTRYWHDLQNNIPCVALIEDFDNIFHGRTNVSGYKDTLQGKYLVGRLASQNELKQPSNDHDDGFSTELTFDTFLNTLDGVDRYEGIFTIITTNQIDKVDAALLNRPGRIDKVVELTHLTEENKIRLIDKICGDMPLARLAALEYVGSHSEPLTPAQLQEKCTELALREFYNKSLEEK